MQLLDHTFASPEENLACDEALLEAAEAGECGEVLRFWEAREPFVVLGYANRAETEVNREACAADRIKILRRASGGGTVIQSAGCLNYALVLETQRNEALRSIRSANRFIMERHAAALRDTPSDGGTSGGRGITVEGDTDLALGGRKFSGNAQRRKTRFILFHGTFLLEEDVAVMEKYLRMPSRQPAYRAGRSHADFVCRLPMSCSSVKERLRSAWNADALLEAMPEARVKLLLRDKYETSAWNLKF
jgi:lipoate-protein ligase A